MNAKQIAEAHQQFQDGAITALELANCCLLYSIEADDLLSLKDEVIRRQQDLNSIIYRWMHHE